MLVSLSRFDLGASGVVLQSQVFQLVPRQPLTQVVRLFFAVQLNFPSFSRCFLFHCFIRRRSHPRVEFFDLASHRFQFGFAPAVFPFYSSSYLQLFGLFYIHSNTVQFCLQAYVLSSQKILYLNISFRILSLFLFTRALTIFIMPAFITKKSRHVSIPSQRMILPAQTCAI